MKHNRGTQRVRDLARGPGRLSAALAIDRRLDGIDLPGRPAVAGSDGRAPDEIGQSKRIGLTRAADRLLRFYVRDIRFVSGPLALNTWRSRRLAPEGEDRRGEFVGTLLGQKVSAAGDNRARPSRKPVRRAVVLGVNGSRQRTAAPDAPVGKNDFRYVACCVRSVDGIGDREMVSDLRAGSKRSFVDDDLRRLSGIDRELQERAATVPVLTNLMVMSVSMNCGACSTSAMAPGV